MRIIMAKQTKNRIINKGVDLFNEKGLNNVRLQHIADACEISVGNLAYHFTDHDLLVKKIVHSSLNHFVADQKSWKKCKYLIDFDNLMIQLHQRMLDYAFLFLDQLEIKRLYPEEYLAISKFYRSLVGNLSSWLKGYWKERNLISDFQDKDLKKCIQDILYHVRFYLCWCNLRNMKPNDILFRSKIWSLIVPYLSEASMNEFEILIHPKLN